MNTDSPRQYDGRVSKTGKRVSNPHRLALKEHRDANPRTKYFPAQARRMLQPDVQGLKVGVL